jgi:hypothetical protein
MTRIDEESKKPPNDSEFSVYFVCLLDILGFKSIFQREGLLAVRGKYKRLMDHVNNQKHGYDLIQTPGGHLMLGVGTSGYFYASDSFLFWMSYNSIALPKFTEDVSEMICLGLETGLPLRGAIAVGESILDEETGEFLGGPIIEADIVNHTQRWIGASFGPSFTEPGKHAFDPKTVLPYKGHYKSLDDVASKFATGLTVDWPRRWRETRNSDVRPVIQNLGLNLDPNGKYSEYYRQAKDFADFSEQNQAWFRKQEQM